MKLEALERLIAPLKARLAMVVSRAVVRRVNDALKLQGLQITLLAGETRDEVERFQQYGFTSVPKDGAEAVALSLGGNRDHCVVIAVEDRRYRLKGLAGGEVALYSSVNGQTIILRQDGRIEVRAPALDIVVTGDATVDGQNVTIDGSTLAKIVSATKAAIVALDVRLGDETAPMSVVLENFLTLFNNHAHSPGGNPPTVPAVIGTHSTVKTKAS
jgi:phage baseplate assembly protein V